MSNSDKDIVFRKCKFWLAYRFYLFWANFCLLILHWFATRITIVWYLLRCIDGKDLYWTIQAVALKNSHKENGYALKNLFTSMTWSCEVSVLMILICLVFWERIPTRYASSFHQGRPKSLAQSEFGYGGAICTNRPLGQYGMTQFVWGSTCVRIYKKKFVLNFC